MPKDDSSAGSRATFPLRDLLSWGPRPFRGALPESEVRTGERSLHDEIERHLDYLAVDGFITTNPDTGLHREIRLTAKGQKFVQPELAEFGQEPMLPQVVKSLENRILTYQEQNEKDGMLYSLREAIAKNAPDFIADVLVKIGAKLVTG